MSIKSGAETQQCFLEAAEKISGTNFVVVITKLLFAGTVNVPIVDAAGEDS
jgi:hypothetical protein